MHKNLNYISGLTTVLIVLLFTSCKYDVLPKPPSQLRLDYPVAEYASFENHAGSNYKLVHKGAEYELIKV